MLDRGQELRDTTKRKLKPRLQELRSQRDQFAEELDKANRFMMEHTHDHVGESAALAAALVGDVCWPKPALVGGLWDVARRGAFPHCMLRVCVRRAAGGRVDCGGAAAHGRHENGCVGAAAGA